ncbi:hypothetical protein P7K49_012047 [Saguinus oedipus]|uniref:Uncharacterized protein n=1 Tax=Saguinus oedipus TaxID=9490 RepID=A0ABQ9VT00_SAGOE|nr:hypothetical protein P7K49_012047 [Saguinus oedipus]
MPCTTSTFSGSLGLEGAPSTGFSWELDIAPSALRAWDASLQQGGVGQASALPVLWPQPPAQPHCRPGVAHAVGPAPGPAVSAVPGPALPVASGTFSRPTQKDARMEATAPWLFWEAAAPALERPRLLMVTPRLPAGTGDSGQLARTGQAGSPSRGWLLKSADLGRHSLLYLKEIGHGWFGKVRGTAGSWCSGLVGGRDKVQALGPAGPLPREVFKTLREREDSGALWGKISTETQNMAAREATGRVQNPQPLLQ